MCGIIGIGSPAERFPLHELELLNNDIRHRGPDDEGYCAFLAESSRLTSFYGAESSTKITNDIRASRGVGAIAGIAHRRFSIIDPTSAGHQPFTLEGSEFSLSFNGEIYNYLELRNELEILGYGPFVTATDTEVMSKAFQAWGNSCFQKFNGFWAAAFLSRDKLVLTRDRVGKKSLYYTFDGSKLVFASEITPLTNYRRRKGLALSVNDNAAHDYLKYDRRNSRFDSLYNEIKQIPAASVVEFCLRDGVMRTPIYYWSLDAITRDSNMSLNKAKSELEGRLTESVALRLRSDVPLAVNLSGGLDSAAIVAIAAKLSSQFDNKITAHNIRYIGDRALDESAAARRIAEHCGASFRQIELDKSQSDNELDSLILAAEEPVHSKAALTQNMAWHEIASEGFKVMLHGSANDELMLGYDYLKKIELMNRFRERRYDSLIRDIAGQPIIAIKLIKWLIGESSSVDEPTALFFSRDFRIKTEKDGFEYLTKINSLNKKTSDRMRADLLELRIPYWCNLMDKNMMNVPVEVRMPYLDKNFLDFIFTVPDRLMLRNGYTKYLLREVLKPMLPPDIVWQKKKVGFSAPPKTFGRGEFEISNDIFDYPGLENYFDLQHVKTHLHTLDSKLSWRIFNFAKWYGLNNL